ncbi:hypothetical protein BCEN4_740056 [Burkholderia cenocepacia]|uniref:hypothetical protein n=1 Tax=Burkholderia cenocepacia TaxID=95486 RepID=UPI00192CB508|nr:hypothetical protein [Burkholderia cenocepacia]CAD9227920.1 hypothetical protein BCEN4_740056 [Burkholderia cenocepacia]
MKRDLPKTFYRDKNGTTIAFIERGGEVRRDTVVLTKLTDETTKEKIVKAAKQYWEDLKKPQNFQG